LWKDPDCTDLEGFGFGFGFGDVSLPIKSIQEYFFKMSRASVFQVYKGYCTACSKNIYLAGPQLIEKAKQIAEALGRTDFNSSNVWLSTSGRPHVMSRKSGFAVSLEMCMGKLFNHEKSSCLKLFVIINL